MTHPFSFSDISICHEKLVVFVLLKNKGKICVLIHKLGFLYSYWVFWSGLSGQLDWKFDDVIKIGYSEFSWNDFLF